MKGVPPAIFLVALCALLILAAEAHFLRAVSTEAKQEVLVYEVRCTLCTPARRRPALQTARIGRAIFSA